VPLLEVVHVLHSVPEALDRGVSWLSCKHVVLLNFIPINGDKLEETQRVAY
jgi:hypothetical protein